MEATWAALVVAAHEFDDPRFQRLRSPAQDVDALAGVLGEAAIGGFEVQTVVNQSSFVVQQELERFFSGRKPDDLLLLYFSCHGLKDPSGRLYFVTTNTTFDLLRSTGVSASFVSEQMEYSRSKRIVVLLDCCYSGAFLKGFRARGDDSVAVDQLQGRGRAVITASRATEYAFEADQLATENARPSMFTGAIVEGLATGKADRNGDGLVSVDELYDYVYDAVRLKVAGQTPGRWTDVEGDLVIARNPRPPVRAAPLPPELQRAVESDAALQRLGAVSELAQWYRGGDPTRQLAAGPALEQLSRDYDERVKAAAALALAPLSVPPAPTAEPVPLLAPAPEAEAGTVADQAEADVTVDVPAGPVGTPPADVVMPAPPTAPGEAPPADRGERAVGWLAAIGGLAVLFAPYPVYLRYDDYTDTLNSVEWFSLGAFVVFGLAVYAANCLVRTTSSKATGLAILTGLLPVAAAQAIITVGDLVHDDAIGPGPGWALFEVGFLLLVAAGVLAARRLRRHASLPAARRGDAGNVRVIGMAAVVLVIGAVASYGWARLISISGDGFLDVARPVHSLVLRLLVVSAVVLVGGRSLPALGKRRAASLTGTALVVVTLFLSNDAIWDVSKWLFLVGFATLAVGAAIVPVLSTIVVPGRLGAVLLAAWAAPYAAWLPSSLSGDRDGNLLAVALVAAGALVAIVAASAPRPRPVPGRLTS